MKSIMTPETTSDDSVARIWLFAEFYSIKPIGSSNQEITPHNSFRRRMLLLYNRIYLSQFESFELTHILLSLIVATLQIIYRVSRFHCQVIFL